MKHRETPGLVLELFYIQGILSTRVKTVIKKGSNVFASQLVGTNPAIESYVSLSSTDVGCV